MLVLLPVVIITLDIVSFDFNAIAVICFTITLVVNV